MGFHCGPGFWARAVIWPPFSVLKAQRILIDMPALSIPCDQGTGTRLQSQECPGHCHPLSWNVMAKISPAIYMKTRQAREPALPAARPLYGGARFQEKTEAVLSTVGAYQGRVGGSRSKAR